MPKVNICEVCGGPLFQAKFVSQEGVFMCRNCSHIQIFPEARILARKDAYGGSPLFDKIRNYFVFLKLNNVIKKNSLKRIFEIGYGDGFLLEKLKKRGFPIGGADNNQLNRKIRASLENEKYVFKVSFEDVGLDKESWDLIFAIHLIEHLRNPDLSFKKIYESLGENGVVFFITPCANSKGFRKYGDFWWNLEDPTHLRFYSFDSIRIALNKAGFEKIEICIPIWDSVSAEASSFLKKFFKSGNKPIMRGAFLKFILLFLIPIFFLRRIVIPSYSSSMLVLAYKNRVKL